MFIYFYLFIYNYLLLLFYKEAASQLRTKLSEQSHCHTGVRTGVQIPRAHKKAGTTVHVFNAPKMK